jgi:hypothetical protein
VTQSDDRVRAAYYCAAEVLRSRKLKGQPVPPWLAAHYKSLDEDIRGVSQSRHESDCAGEESETEQWIGAREAGEILGRSKRQVHRIAASLGGELIDGRWLFRKSEVNEYAEDRDDHTGSSAGTGAR